MIRSRHFDIYIASCVQNGGIYHYKMADGNLQLFDVINMDRPMYMTEDHHKMYIVLREPFSNKESGVIIYDKNPDGKLIKPSPIIPTKGRVACHIMSAYGRIYCVNYLTGNVVRLPDMVVQHIGRGVHPVRQTGPHAHFIEQTPDGKYLCVADLGLDAIFLYNWDMTLHTKVSLPPGSGVRHLTFSEDGNFLFAVNELQSTVAAFIYHSGQLVFISLCSTVPAYFDGENAPAAIRVKDGNIYVSNRGHDSIACLTFDGRTLTLVNCIACGGRTPRDFVFVDKYLLCANQDSNQIAVFDMEDEFNIVRRLEIERPFCVLQSRYKACNTEAGKGTGTRRIPPSAQRGST